MVCPVILTTTLLTRGRRALGFGLWDCAIRFAWACSPIRAVIFHPTAIPGSCTLGMLVGVLGKHWTWWLVRDRTLAGRDRKSTRLNSSHSQISYAVFCLKKKKNN